MSFFRPGRHLLAAVNYPGIQKTAVHTTCEVFLSAQIRDLRSSDTFAAAPFPGIRLSSRHANATLPAGEDGSVFHNNTPPPGAVHGDPSSRLLRYPGLPRQV
jgi:hypothetical protein